MHIFLPSSVPSFSLKSVICIQGEYVEAAAAAQCWSKQLESKPPLSPHRAHYVALPAQFTYRGATMRSSSHFMETISVENVTPYVGAHLAARDGGSSRPPGGQ